MTSSLLFPMLAGIAYDGRFSNVHGTIHGLNGLLSLYCVSGSEKHTTSTGSEGPGSSEARRLRGGEATLTVAPKNFTSSPKELPTLGRRRQADGFWPGRRGPDMWNELGRQAEASINSTIITRTNATPRKRRTLQSTRPGSRSSPPRPPTLRKMTAQNSWSVGQENGRG